ncbi:MAG: DUF4175 family protein [Proteobacteria bacterium]|nr:DUF4175 family protein [Pseudomonadota bacterium]
MADIKYALILSLSFLSLLWERLWNRLWAVVSLVLLFIAVALLKMPEMFGAIGPLISLVIFIPALVIVFVYTEEKFSFPTRAEVERRIEKISALEHRPLETLHDKPIAGLSDVALGLWRRHLQKTAGYITGLRVYTPCTNVARRDKLALRHVVVLLLVVGLVVAQKDSLERIRQAFAPDIGHFMAQKTGVFDLWIVPPEYTHESAVFLATAGQGVVARDKTVKVSEGSILKLRLSGYRWAPRLYYAEQRHDLTEAAPGNFTLELSLQQSGALRLASWLSTLGEWAVTVVADTPPDISVDKIEATPRSATKITYKANDDHGVTKIAGTMALVPELQEKLGHQKYLFNVPVSHEVSHVEDLTPHLWAGLPVAFTLEAEDGAGHKSSSAPYTFTLPERPFTNPVAQKLVEQRKSLLWAKESAARNAVIAALADIISRPPLYKNDGMVFLLLSIAAKRLIYDHSDAAVESVQDLLWDVALKLDDGGLSLVQRELREALQKLSSSLDDKSVSKQQLQDMLEDVQKKMQQYVQALAVELQQRLQEGKATPVLSPELAQKFMQNMDISKMLEQMRQLSQTNSRENLQKMADDLKNAIDNLDMKKIDEIQEKQMQTMQDLQKLKDVVHQQQGLLDKTNKSNNVAAIKQQSPEQAAIRQKLGEVLGELDRLGEGRAAVSVPHQKTALEELQKGVDSLASQMAAAMQQSILSFGMSPGGGHYGEGYDPLGRDMGGAVGSVKIPDEKEQRRVQEIIEELRHRSNESNRDKVERDYIDRLLDQF